LQIWQGNKLLITVLIDGVAQNSPETCERELAKTLIFGANLGPVSMNQ